MMVDDLIVGIDLGSSKIVTAIAEVDETGGLSVIGIGRAKSSGAMIRNGVIVNINAVVEAIRQSITDAEMQAGREVTHAVVAVSGKDVQSIDSQGVVAISGSDKEIRPSDVQRVIESARAMDIPRDRGILHVIPQWYSIDGQDNIKNPIGMFGTRLESRIHVITTMINSVQNVQKAFERLGISIESTILQNIAAAKAVLSSDEEELGVLLIDIGEDTSNVSVYTKQSPVFTTVRSKAGGQLISNDLSFGLGVSFQVADKIKLESAVADYSYVDDSEYVSVPTVGSRGMRECPKSQLVDIIKPRIVEMFENIKRELEDKGIMELVQGGVVLTGGTANIPGIEAVAYEVFGRPARVGVNDELNGLSDALYGPEYSVVSGLLLKGYEKMEIDASSGNTSHRGSSGDGFIGKVRGFIKAIF